MDVVERVTLISKGRVNGRVACCYQPVAEATTVDYGPRIQLSWLDLQAMRTWPSWLLTLLSFRLGNKKKIPHGQELGARAKSIVPLSSLGRPTDKTQGLHPFHWPSARHTHTLHPTTWSSQLSWAGFLRNVSGSSFFLFNCFQSNSIHSTLIQSNPIVFNSIKDNFLDSSHDGATDDGQEASRPPFPYPTTSCLGLAIDSVSAPLPLPVLASRFSVPRSQLALGADAIYLISMLP